LDTYKRKDYELKKEPNWVRLVLSIDSTSITALERLGWWPKTGVDRSSFSLLGVKRR
jgi:hypothetical protein